MYHIIIRYYSEAEEGHGYRFRTMLETFSVIDPTSIIQPQVNTVTKSTELDTDTRKAYAATLRNLLYSNILPDGKQAEMPAGSSSQFAVADVDADGKEELVLLYDSGVTANSAGYIIGYDAETGNIYIPTGGISVLCLFGKRQSESSFLPQSDLWRDVAVYILSISAGE